MLKVESRLTYAQIRHDQALDAHLVLSLTAPPLAEEAKRQAIFIVAAIDVSPSMEGAKLAYAKQSAIKLIDHLQPGDYFGLVDFAQNARLVVKPQKVSPEFKDTVKRAIGALNVRSATNIADALLVSLDAANKMDLGSEVITRCILFTDGDANTGVAIRSKDILSLLEKNLGIATVSAFGYGTDVKQELLVDLARAGKANYAFVKNPDDALSAFGKELGGLISMVATDIVIELTPLAEHRMNKVVSDVDAEEDVTGHVTIKIPDLLAEETRHIVLGVTLAAQKSVGPRAVNVFEARIHYDVIGQDGRKERKSFESKAKVQFVKEGDEQKTPTKEVDEIVAQAQIVHAQIEAEQAAQRGDFKSANASFTAAALDIAARGHVGLGDVVGHVHQMYATPASYRGTSGNRAVMRRAMSRGVGVSGLDQADAVVLQSANYGMSNSSQNSMVTSFTGGGVVTPDVTIPPAAQPANVLSQQTVTPIWVGGNTGHAVPPYGVVVQPAVAPTAMPLQWAMDPAVAVPPVDAPIDMEAFRAALHGRPQQNPTPQKQALTEAWAKPGEDPAAATPSTKRSSIRQSKSTTRW